ncbi:TPA: hypothetical protein N0F65_000251 [Lagenidium giganteum]|uniref:FYVE-type domain-containing protein n=1 Tax=Lagenidium giganteum TaxID=4803 RepID=A0AAV2Z7K6_9STRA|nr:TPA: hypothetical protein N0F65_000251 [Lagenidium giganteum]
MTNHDKFPLPLDTFPPLNVSTEKAEELESLANSLLCEHLAEYERFVYTQHQTVDRRVWTPIKRRENVRVYKERRRAMASRHSSASFSSTDIANQFDTAMPMMLTVGAIAGTLDDVMYGVVNGSDMTMRLKTSYIRDDMPDGRILHAIVPVTAAEPFRFVGLKWQVKGASITDSIGIKCRDFVYVESTGIVNNVRNERVGYHLLQSVDLPEVRNLQKPYGIIRGKMSFCYLYRQKASGVVDVYMRGFFDVAGEVLTSIATSAASMSLVSIWRVVHCAQMKKLVWLLRNRMARNSEGDKSKQNGPVEASHCASCQTTFNLFHRHSRCRLCTASVCKKCSVQKKLNFPDATASTAAPMTPIVERKFTFCTTCVQAAQRQNAQQIASQELAGSPPTSATEAVENPPLEAAESSACCSIEDIERQSVISTDASSSVYDIDFGRSSEITSSQVSSETFDESEEGEELQSRKIYRSSLVGIRDIQPVQLLQQEEVCPVEVKECETVVFLPPAERTPHVEPVESTTAQDMAQLYEKMMALQAAADKTYQITRATTTSLAIQELPQDV